MEPLTTLAFKPKTHNAAAAFNNVASQIPCDCLLNSPGLRLVWRTAFYPDLTPAEYAPVKPIWFARANVHLLRKDACCSFALAPTSPCANLSAHLLLRPRTCARMH